MIEVFQEKIREAAARGLQLRLRGGGSKDFYGNAPRGELLDTRPCAGIVSYEPTELVITARGGTPLSLIEKALDEKAQFFPFEPPYFGGESTLGGCIAAGLSGPRRASAGAVRDFILGAKIIDGRGRLLAFGGQVMKNVAGYDVSRLLTGSLVTLGLIVEASLKVLPRPAEESTLRLALDEARALDTMAGWAAQPLPISATAWKDGVLAVRLSGAAPAVRAAARRIGGEPGDGALWPALREHAEGFFSGPQPLWRIALPATAAPLALSGTQLIEWNGAQRWLRTDAAAGEVRVAANRAGGHATLFRAADKRAGAFTPLDPAKLRLHQALKQAFDPAGILNPGRLYAEF